MHGQNWTTRTHPLPLLPSLSESKETRRELHWMLFQILFNKHTDFFTGNKRDYVYDCALLLYALTKLLRNGEKREFLLNPEDLVSQNSFSSPPPLHTFLLHQRNCLFQDELSDRSRSYIRRVDRIKAFLTATEEVQVSNGGGATNL